MTKNYTTKPVLKGKSSAATRIHFHIPLIIILMLLLSSSIGWGQQVIGSFPSMDGGYENQTGTLVTASSISTPQIAWTTQAAIAGVISASGGRSGPKFVTYTQSGTTHRRLQSPTSDIPAGSYTVQFYYQGDLDGGAFGDIRGAISSNGTSGPSYGAYVTGANTGSTWTKYTATVTPGTYIANIGIGIVSVNNTAQFKIDDFVVYAGTADNTAPNSPGTVTVGNVTPSSLDISWVAASGGEDGGGYVAVRYSSDPGTGNDPNQNGIYAMGNSVETGGTVVYIGTGTSFTDNGLSSSTPFWYKVYTVDKAFNYSDESTGTGATSASGTPTLNVAPSSLDGFNYVLGAGPSDFQQYSLSGSDLTDAPGNITVTGTADYEVSSDNLSYDATAYIPYSSATLSATPVYVRLKSGLAVNTYNSESVANTGGGVIIAVNVTCNGLVYDNEPSNHATNFQAGIITSLTISLTWTDATGGTLPTGYLVKGSATSYAAISQPVDFTPEADGDFVKNIAAGVGTVTFSGLQPNTAYYFKIWPYTNTGSYIDYKLNGTVPQQSVSTLQLYFRSVVSGAWNNSATWEISSDNSFWSAATTEIPVYRTADVTIKSGHSVTVPINYNSGIAKNLTVENTATLFANSASGSCFVYVYGNILNDGTIGGTADVIGFDIEGASCNLSGNGSFIVSRMAKFTTSNATTNYTINQNVTLTYTSTTGNALYNSQSATTMFNIIIAAGKQLTVSPAKISLTGCTLTLNSDITGTASLLDNGITGTGNVTVQRYIGAWTDAAHGWHLLSSPVGLQTIDPAFTNPTPANYDFYKWDEVTNSWLNQKLPANNITSFVPGTGYLVAYQSASTKQFDGTLNTANVPVSGLTYTTGGANRGWNLLGNPFPCALTWGTANWALTNVTSTAKIWQESTAAYVDIPPTTGIIPTMNGFMVETSGSGSLTIPIAERVHNAAAWYKDSEGLIKLVASDPDNNTAQESIIKVNANATEGFDKEYDSHFLSGYAPQFYSVAGDEFLSTNSLPNFGNGRTIEMGFVKNTATEFSIGLNTEDLIPGLVVYLTDKKTGAVTELTQNHEYAFTASEGDDANRFLLHFGALGIDDPPANESYRIYSHDGNIYIASQQAAKADVSVCNILGQVVMRSQTDGAGLTSLDGNTLQNGIYLVRVNNGNQVVSRKVLISR